VTRALLAGVLAAALAGCVAPVGTVTAPIFGGSETTEHPEVGWIVYDDGFVCSAVLVGSTRAITAAHCVYAFAADPAALGVVFSAGSARPPASVAVAVAELHLAPDYTVDSSRDIAVLELADAPPVGPVPYRTDALGDAELDGRLRLVGFGLTAADDPGDDRARRSAEVVLDEIDTVSVRWFNEDAGLCDGDSGGAVFLDGPGGWELAAVGTEGDPECASRGAGVRTDAFAAFLADPGDAGDDDDVAWPNDDDDDDVPPAQACGTNAALVPLLALPCLGLRRRGPSEP